MPNNLTMPRLSDTMEVGTIVKWHVKPGQKVKSGEVVADIETDKATMELQTFEDGVVVQINTPEGQSVPVGTLILSFEGGTTSGAAKAAPGKSAAAATASANAATTNEQATATATLIETNGTHSTRVFASPLARKIAADSGVDLTSIAGSGPSGRIIRKDVEAALSAPAARRGEDSASSTSVPFVKSAAKSTLVPATRVPSVVETSGPSGGLQHRVWPLTNMRRTIAARLVESKTTIPHYQVTVAVRMDALMGLREQLNQQLAGQGVKLSVNDFIVRACALAMHQHPYINTRWVGTKGAEAIEFLDTVNIGVAIALPVNADATGGGLVVATLRNADQLGLRHISANTKALADKARAKGLSIDEMSDATFTISNLGMFGVEDFTAIINPPNTAILAVGGAIKKPVVETKDGKDTLVIGHEMQMTLSSDHRVIDGAMAAQYLATVKSMLEKPAALLV